MEDDLPMADSSRRTDSPTTGEAPILSDALRNSAVARLLVEGKLKTQSDFQSAGEPPMDLSSKSTRITEEEFYSSKPEVTIENVDPERIACPDLSPELSPEVSREVSPEVPAEVSSNNGSSCSNSNVNNSSTTTITSSSKPPVRKRRKKQQQPVVSAEEGDLRCPYCPFLASNKTTMSSHFQFHQQILGSQSSTSRNSHLEWIQAYQAGHSPVEARPGSTGTPTGSVVSPSTQDPIPQVGSPTLRSLLVGGATTEERQHTASGFLRSIVQNMMTTPSPGMATATASVSTAPFASSSSSVASSRSTSTMTAATTATVVNIPRANYLNSSAAVVASSSSSSSSTAGRSMLASVLAGNTVPVPVPVHVPVPIEEPVRVKTEPIDFSADRIYTPHMVPTSTTGSSPITDPCMDPTLVRIKEEPRDECPLDPHDPEWTPDSHSGCSSPASGTGQPVTTNTPGTGRNSRKGSPKKRILGSFLQRREDELGMRGGGTLSQATSSTSSVASSAMMSLLQGPPRGASGSGRGKRAHPSSTSSPQTAPGQYGQNQGVRVIYVDKNDGKTFLDKSIQCQLLVDDMSRETEEAVKKLHRHDNIGGLEDPRLGLVVGEAQEGQMGGHLHSTKCPHCNITFDDEVLHSIHMGCHSHRDPFICNVCGKHCSHKYEFYTHIVRGHQIDDSV